MKEKKDMKCKKIKIKLVEYYESSLLPEESKLVQEHLEICPECQKELQGIKSTFELLKKESLYQPEEFYWTNFVAGVRSKIEKRTDTTVVVIPKWKIAGAAVTFLFIIILGVSLFIIDQRIIFKTGGETYTYFVPVESESIEQLIYTEGYDDSYAFLFTDKEKKNPSMLEEEFEETYWDKAGKDKAFGEMNIKELENLKKGLKEITFKKEIL